MTTDGRVRVAVIGAGPVGLMAMKTFMEDGFDVTGFETRSYVGGLWKESMDSSLSVHATTTFNSSKYRSAISDFPFAEEDDDFPTARQMHEYLTRYADHFEVTPKVQFNTKVVDMERVGDQWALKLQPVDGGPVQTRHFDKVAFSTGAFSTPKIVQLENQNTFAGPIIHSINYHGPEPYVGKNVLMLGIHATAQDVATSLKETANKVYLSHRTGLLLMSAFAENGATFDQTGPLRFVMLQTFMSAWFPTVWAWVVDKLLGMMSKKAFNTRPEWGFSPAPSFAIATPLIADKLYSLLESGFATPVGEIKRVTGPKSVELVDGTELHDLDAIVQCTGYEFAMPALPASSPYQPYPDGAGSSPKLWHNVFPLDPDPAVRNSLVFFGQGVLAFPGFVQWELVGQAVSQTWLGRSPLPSLSKMRAWHTDHLAWRAGLIRRYGHSSTFYVGLVEFADHFRWLDAASGSGIFATFDWAWFNPRSWRLWWRDRDLYNVCMGGLCTPTIFRLLDMGKRKPWPGAREQIFRDNEVARQGTERKFRAMQEEQKQKQKQKANGHAIDGNGHLNGKTNGHVAVNGKKYV